MGNAPASKADRKPFNFSDFAGSDYAKNRQLFEWLSDDQDRAELFDYVNGHLSGVFKFPSRAHTQDDPAPPFSVKQPIGHSPVYFICKRDLILEAMGYSGKFSNSPYTELGTGAFMLALDAGGNPDFHQAQRLAAQKSLPSVKQTDLIRRLCVESTEQASVTSLANTVFDVAQFSEQAALRFCTFLYGFSAQDFGLLEDSMRAAYRALNYQMLGRHFLSEPATLPQAKLAMAGLLKRTSALVDDYQRLDPAMYPNKAPGQFNHHGQRHLLPMGVEPLANFGLGGIEPVMKRLAAQPDNLTGQELAVVVVGSIAGIVGNVQASVCIAIDAIFNQLKGDVLVAAKRAAHPNKQTGLADDETLHKIVMEALRLNPPAPFLPRRSTQDQTLDGVQLPKDAQCILTLGGGTCGNATERVFRLQPNREDPLIFGYEPHSSGGNVNPGGLHWCIGNYLAKPLILEVVKKILCLPSVAQRLDRGTGEVVRLQKRWGFANERYPMVYKREKRLVQSPLNVIMKIKAPTNANAERLKQIIRFGAPRIDRALREARHVHFAWFEFLENDTKLVLHTVYDGDFDAYVQHFALKVDDLFDQLFEFIENAPPRPVADNPDAFVATIKRFNTAPAEGYFFSAYPLAEVPQIVRKV